MQFYDLDGFKIVSVCYFENMRRRKNVFFLKPFIFLEPVMQFSVLILIIEGLSWFLILPFYHTLIISLGSSLHRFLDPGIIQEV